MNSAYYIVLEDWKAGRQGPNRYLCGVKEADGEEITEFTTNRLRTEYHYETRRAATEALYDFSLQHACMIHLRMGDEEYSVSPDSEVADAAERDED